MAVDAPYNRAITSKKR